MGIDNAGLFHFIRDDATDKVGMSGFEGGHQLAQLFAVQRGHGLETGTFLGLSAGFGALFRHQVSRLGEHFDQQCVAGLSTHETGMKTVHWREKHRKKRQSIWIKQNNDDFQKWFFSHFLFLNTTLWWTFVLKNCACMLSILLSFSAVWALKIPFWRGRRRCRSADLYSSPASRKCCMAPCQRNGRWKSGHPRSNYNVKVNRIVELLSANCNSSVSHCLRMDKINQESNRVGFFD